MAAPGGSDKAGDNMEEQREQEPRLLFVLVHGWLGTTADWASLAGHLKERYPTCEVLISGRNSALSSNNGIEAGGRALAREIADFLLASSWGPHDPRSVPDVRPAGADLHLELAAIHALVRARQSEHSPLPKLAVVGHSLGGLYLRHALASLHAAGFFGGPDAVVRPVSYVSVATPHLGSRRPREGLKGTFINLGLASAEYLGVSQTITDLCMNDGSPPILLRMSEPGSVFLLALLAFSSRTVVSTTHHDDIVPFPSAAILATNIFARVEHSAGLHVVGSSGFGKRHRRLFAPYTPPGVECQLSDDSPSEEEYETASEDAPELQLTRGPSREELESDRSFFVCDDAGLVEYHTAVLENLQQLPWRRLHVQFASQSLGQRLLSHEAPLAKAKSPMVMSILGIDDKCGTQFLQLLVDTLAIDMEAP